MNEMAYPIKSSHGFISASNLYLVEESLCPITSFSGTLHYHGELVSANYIDAASSDLDGTNTYRLFCLHLPKRLYLP